MTFRDDFTAGRLDRAVWFPHYLPAWSSRAQTEASYELTPEGLRLLIPLDAGLWCPDEHPAALRVSGIQSGNRSGRVGSTDGQQRFRDDLKGASSSRASRVGYRRRDASRSVAG